MNLTSKDCKIKPGNCPDKEKQEKMINEIKSMEQEVNEDKAVILFEDATHQLHTTHTGKAIQFKGNANTKVLESNTGRSRYTILGAINPIDFRFSSCTTDGMCNMDLLKILLDRIAMDYNKEIELGKTIYMILDNARYQKANEVQEYAKKLKITFKFLPPYCPHLNLIERLWRWFKNKLKNLYFKTFDDFKSYIDSIILSVPQSEGTLKNLLTFNFRIL